MTPDDGNRRRRRSARAFRYGAWSGGADPLAPPFDVRAALDEVGEEMFEGRSAREALRDLLRRGQPGRRGLDDVRRSLERRRRQLLKRGNLAGTLDLVRQMLDEALASEHETLAGEDGDSARLAEASLDDLPPDTAGAVRELADYAWHSAEAAAAFAEIRKLLRSEVLDAQFAGMKQALANEDSETMQRARDMLGDLNALLEAHRRGDDVARSFDDFMTRHGNFFAEQPRDVEDLLDLLARRSAAAEQLMGSLSSSQRAELQDLLSQALDDPELESAVIQLRDQLAALRPGASRQQVAPIAGNEALGYGDAVGAVADLSDLEALDRQLGQNYPGSTLDDVDVDAVDRQLAPSAGRDVRALQRLESELERQGYLRRGTQGLELTPKALRRLGETALRHVFDQLDAGAGGRHDDRRTGAADERTGAFVPWHFGDQRPIDAVRTAHNAVLRRAASATTGDAAADLRTEDFEVAETERRTGAAVALCVDLSFSMVQEDRWAPMKQTALALAHLISTRHRTDALQIIGFDRRARPLSALELAAVEPEWDKGTNLQQALLLARRHLRRHPEAEPVVMVVTDGEPTAHVDADGVSHFEWPPTREAISATLAEVDAMTRIGARLNFFLLGDDPGLARFVDAAARRNAGRVFTPEPHRLGEYVVADYLAARSGRRSA